MKSKFVAAILLLASCCALRASDGFYSFYVVDGDTAQLQRKQGIISNIVFFTTGEVVVYFDANGSTDYQVSVSNDGTPIEWYIRERSGTKFVLGFRKLDLVDDVWQLVAYNPESLCTVTVDRLPAE